MKRVLFVDSYPHSLFGQQQTLMGLLARCAGAGIEATVAAPNEGVFLDAVRATGVRCEVQAQPEVLGRYGGAVYRDGPVGKIRTAWRALGYALRLRRWLRKEGFACVFCNDLRGLLTFGLAARLAGAPVLIWDKLDQPHGALDQLQLPLASRNLVISHSVITKYPRWQRSVFGKRIRLLHDGIAAGDFAAMAEKYSPRREGEVVLGIVGSITPRKGHDLLLAAYLRARAEAPELKLRVIGDAPEGGDASFRDRLVARTEGDPTVEWLGWRTDMAVVMAGLDILVSPSRREGLGRVNIEAMAAGKPVIGAAGTGIADVIVEGETGFLVDPTDEAALADRILQLARDPKLRARMGAAGRRRTVAEFDQDRQLGKVLNEILDLAR